MYDCTYQSRISDARRHDTVEAIPDSRDKRIFLAMVGLSR
jgi:hypothetical protein